MSDVTQLLSAIDQGDPKASEELLPVVYEELRRLAAAKLAREAAGQTLQATALVHEAWLRLVGSSSANQHWDHRGHFFGAAAEAMRRILVERARRRKVLVRGGYEHRTEFSDSDLRAPGPEDELLGVHEALQGLATAEPRAAELVKLRYFLGMSMPEAADTLGMTQRSAERVWTFAKAWLKVALKP